MSTIRQQMLDLLEKRACNARAISQQLGITEKEASTHMPHVQKTANRMGKTLKVLPARCLNCDYEFRSRKKFAKPGRCPQCKKQRIDPPVFRII